MPPRFPVPENPDASPLSEGPGFRRVAIIVGVVLVVLVMMRLYLRQDSTLTEKSYDRPIGQRHLALHPRDEEFPGGWSLDEEPRYAKMAGDVPEMVAELGAVKIPEPTRVDQMLVAAYRDPSDQPAWIVAARYRGEAPACTEAAVRQDHHLAWAVRAEGVNSGTLAGALKSKARRIKRVRVWAEKMKTLGSAYVQFGMDVVGFMLLACLLLFLTKYFLISRQTEGI